MAHLIYLEDAYCGSFSAQITDVAPEGNGRWSITLDQTAFYPMGGGQATDQGTLTGENWKGDVIQVLFRKGNPIHTVKAVEAPPIGMKVQGELNWERRYHNMRLHSAGHVVDFAMLTLGLSPHELTPIKAEHRKKPYILYQGIFQNDFLKNLQREVDTLIAENRAFSTSFVEREGIEDRVLYQQPGLPDNKPLRILCLEGIGCVLDGGTQVKTTAECGPILIQKIEEKDNQTTIYYTLNSENGVQSHE